MEGRFDAGIALGDEGHDGSVEQAGPGRFLGFDVVEIDIIRYERPRLVAMLPRRMQRALGERAA
jgi:polysaccharide biosynthesis transport protein